MVSGPDSWISLCLSSSEIFLLDFLLLYESDTGSQYSQRSAAGSQLSSGIVSGPNSWISLCLSSSAIFLLDFLLLYESDTGSQYSQSSDSVLDVELVSILESLSYPANVSSSGRMSSGTLSLVLLLL